VEDRQDDEQGANQAPGERRQRPEADFRIEFLFELASLGFIEFKGRHRSRSGFEKRIARTP
jgi:hypothetical protein